MRYEALCAALAVEIPGFRVIRKDASRLHRLIDRALVALTLGGMRDYLTGYQTTIGATVYTTADWDDRTDAERYVTMRHEAVHLRQFRKYGLVGTSAIYLLVPGGRAHLEKQAYAETVRAAAEVFGARYPRRTEFRAHIIAQFVGPSYVWMWPFPRAMERWYDQVLASLDENS